MNQYAPAASTWPGGRIPDYVRELGSVAIAVIGRDGSLIDANVGFSSLLPDGMTAAAMRDVRDLFINPRFDQLAMRRSDKMGGAIYRGIINLGSVLGSVCSVHGALYSLDSELLLVAEQEVAGLELLRSRVLRLNDELVEEQRRLANALRELKRQKRLAEAAIRDRDELRARLVPS